jgi:4-hydroxybenzoate polyprenyltransferase
MAVPSAVDIPTCTCDGRAPVTLVGNMVAIARHDHWFKNIFILPGGALALVLASDPLPGTIGLLLAKVSTCLIGRANHAIKAWLDAGFDRHHPIEKHRPSATGQMSAQVVYAFRKLGPRWRANRAKRVARVAVFA